MMDLLMTVLVLQRVTTWRGGAGSIWHMQFRRYSYVVASEGSTHGNSAISHTGGEKSATTWRGLTPILFFNGAKPTVRGANMMLSNSMSATKG